MGDRVVDRQPKGPNSGALRSPQARVLG